MKRIPPLHLLVALEAIARHESVTKAAKELHLTTSAISHRLSSLQELLGVRLLIKRHDGVSLTPEGRSYSNAVCDLLQRVANLSNVFDDAVGSSVLRIRTGPSFAEIWLVPRLAEFRRLHPAIHVKLEASMTAVDFRRDALDLWVCRGRPSEGELVAESIIPEHFIPLASPAYLARHAITEHADLSVNDAIYCSRCSPNWSDWFRRYRGIRHDMDWSLAFSHASHALQAASQGLGVVFESREIAQPFMSNRRLAPVFTNDAGIDGPGYALLYPARHLDRPAVAAFRSWLLTTARQAGGVDKGAHCH